MGVTTPIAEFVVEAAAQGVRFDRTATIGRQGLFVGPLRLRRLLARHGRRLDPELPGAPWVDPLLRALGAREIVSIDASPYEGADRVHDLNEPLPDDLRRRFDTVLDAGTLEHVFDVPAALRACMDMVDVGGHLLLAVPANNYFGHGFYQFGPDLFQRVLAPENGFELERLEACENDVHFATGPRGIAVPLEHRGPRYAVADPAGTAERVELQTRRPVLLLVQARRTEAVEVLRSAPQQSFYADRWSGGEQEPASAARPPRVPAATRLAIVLDVIPLALRPLTRLRLWRLARRRSFRNRRFFRPARRD